MTPRDLADVLGIDLDYVMAALDRLGEPGATDADTSLPERLGQRLYAALARAASTPEMVGARALFDEAATRIREAAAKDQAEGYRIFGSEWDRAHARVRARGRGETTLSGDDRLLLGILRNEPWAIYEVESEQRRTAALAARRAELERHRSLARARDLRENEQVQRVVGDDALWAQLGIEAPERDAWRSVGLRRRDGAIARACRDAGLTPSDLALVLEGIPIVERLTDLAESVESVLARMQQAHERRGG
jgi:hypothetical protein